MAPKVEVPALQDRSEELKGRGRIETLYPLGGRRLHDNANQLIMLPYSGTVFVFDIPTYSTNRFAGAFGASTWNAFIPLTMGLTK